MFACWNKSPKLIWIHYIFTIQPNMMQKLYLHNIIISYDNVLLLYYVLSSLIDINVLKAGGPGKVELRHDLEESDVKCHT